MQDSMRKTQLEKKLWWCYRFEKRGEFRVSVQCVLSLSVGNGMEEPLDPWCPMSCVLAHANGILMTV